MKGVKKMPKKEIKHINGTKADSKELADAKKQEPVDVKWEKTPSWTVMHSFGRENKSSDYFGKIEKDKEE
jgi:hypothetical protein